MGNRGRQLSHRCDAIDVRELRLRFAVSPLTFAGLAPEPRQLQVCIDAGDQLAGAERLQKIVIGACFESLNLRFLASTRREQDDRYIAKSIICTDRSNEAEPVEPRHHHIGEDEVRTPRPGGVERRLTVWNRLHLIARGQQAPHIIQHIGVVVGDQHRSTFDSSNGLTRTDQFLFNRNLAWGSTAGERAQRLLDEGFRLDPRRGHRRFAADSLSREVGGARRDRHREGCAAPENALRPHRAAMQPDEFLHER